MPLREGEVDGQTLTGLFSCPDSVAASIILGLLQADTSWTDVEDTIHVRESWDSISMPMDIEQVEVAWMSETLMPEKSLSGSLDSRHWCVELDVLIERQPMELSRQLGHLLTQLGFDCFVVSINGQCSSLLTLLSKFRVAFES